METFKERDWATRKNGDFFDHSENKFEQHWDGPFAHFGFGAATEGMATYKMSPFVSHTPDYIAATSETARPVLVEVQGTGKGGSNNGVITHKFKAKKLECLGKWNVLDEVTLWLWNDADQTFVWTSYVSVRGMIGRGMASMGTFDGNRPYYEIPVDLVAEHADTARLRGKYG